MMPTALLLCGFPTLALLSGFPAFDGRCQAAYIPLATAKLTLSPLIPNPSPKFFARPRIFRRLQAYRRKYTPEIP